MITFEAVRHSPISPVTSREIWPRTATNNGERDQLQPEPQPPRSTGSLLTARPSARPPSRAITEETCREGLLRSESLRDLPQRDGQDPTWSSDRRPMVRSRPAPY